jgi:hypothetical protein
MYNPTAYVVAKVSLRTMAPTRLHGQEANHHHWYGCEIESCVTHPTIEISSSIVATIAPPIKAPCCSLVSAFPPSIIALAFNAGYQVIRGTYARETSNQQTIDSKPESKIPRKDIMITHMRTGRQQQNRGRWKI